ncbi:MFS transporter [Rubrobacter marinus]|uniref:MFS transporter n=1 Tax=Rubrobacter marinus TaxID=2653852 RepID=A0A6G8Q0A2_9ACTN|nr:MFS transporter [Rubrobacter marinus]QIN79914.1 MFS transporter [Rubrobacter marinus]
MSTASAPFEPSEKRNLRPMLIAVSVATVGVLPSFLTGGLAVQIRGEFGFGAGALGLAVAVFFVVSSLSSALAGRVAERIGSHAAMRTSSLVGALALLAVALLAGSWWGLVACLVLGGAGNAIAQPSTNLLIAREVPVGRHGLAFGVKQAAIPVATLLAGLAVPVIAVTLGWRWAFAGGALLALVVALLVPRENDGEPPGRLKEARAGDAPLAPLILLAVGIGLGSTAATPLGAFVVESAVSTGVEVGTAGLLLALGSGVGIVVRVVAGHLADGMTGGRLRLVAGMLVLGTAGFAMLASGAPGLLVVGVVLAFGAGWGWPGLFNFAIVKSSPKAPAAATGITQTGASGGAALGPLLFGYTVEATSFGTAWIATAAVALLSAAAILAGRRLLLRRREGPEG